MRCFSLRATLHGASRAAIGGAARFAAAIRLVAGSLLITGCLVIEDSPADTTVTGEKASVAAAAAAKAARDSIAELVARRDRAADGLAGASSGAAKATDRPVPRSIDSLPALGNIRDSVAERGKVVVASARTPNDAARDEPPVPPTPDELAALRNELVMPIASVAPSRLFDSFGDKRGSSRRHAAIDIPAPRGTPVVSAAPGRVMRLFSSKDGGLMVYAADATERFILMYAHLDAYAPGLADGAALARGQTIGYVGTTGNAPPDVPHLHFAIARTPNVMRWWTGVPVNPYPLLHRP